MAYYPPRPRPSGRPKSIARIVRKDFPDMPEDRVLDISHTIHKRLREQPDQKAKNK